MFKVIKVFCRLLSNYASPFVIASAIVAFFVPVAFGWVHGNVSSVILGVIMLSMGLTISIEDVRNLMKQPYLPWPSLLTLLTWRRTPKPCFAWFLAL